MQQVKVGSIDIMLTGSSIWATVAPEFGMLDLGYVFDSYAHMARALDGGVGASLAEILRGRTGCTIMGWGSHFAARSVYTKAPVRSVAELKGVKVRVLPTSAFIDTFKLMGAVPTPIPFNELYTAVQTGVVDGFEHDASTVLATKLYEVTRHCFLTEHLFPPMVAVIGKRGLDKIPADIRPAFLQAAQEASLYQRAQAAEKGRAAFEELKKLGITFHPMTKAERDALRRLMEAQLWPEFANQYPPTRPLFQVDRERALARRQKRGGRQNNERSRGLRLPVRQAARRTPCPGPAADCNGNFRGAGAGDRRTGGVVLGRLALFSARSGGLGGRNRARPDGHAGFPRCCDDAGARAACRHRQLSQPVSGVLASGADPALPLDHRRGRDRAVAVFLRVVCGFARADHADRTAAMDLCRPGRDRQRAHAAVRHCRCAGGSGQFRLGDAGPRGGVCGRSLGMECGRARAGDHAADAAGRAASC